MKSLLAKKFLTAAVLMLLLMSPNITCAQDRQLGQDVDPDELLAIQLNASKTLNKENTFRLGELIAFENNDHIQYGEINSKEHNPENVKDTGDNYKITGFDLPLPPEKIYKVFVVDPKDPFELTKTCFLRFKEYSEATTKDYPAPILTQHDWSSILNEFKQKLQASQFSQPSSWIDDQAPSDIFLTEQCTERNEFAHPFVQKLIVAPESKICFVGDIHGSIHSLLRILWRLVALRYLDKEFKIIKDNFYMIFNGDFVDRGRYGIEVWYALLLLKLANWDRVFLLKGNHESHDCSNNYGFADECANKYPECGERMTNTLKDDIYKLYRFLPFAVYLGSGNDNSFVQCCHGGIEPGFDPEQLIENPRKIFQKISADHNADCTDYDFYSSQAKEKHRNNYEGFNWSDFCQNNRAPNVGKIFLSGRGSGYLADVAATNKYLSVQNKKIKAFFRGHQDRNYGFKMLFTQTTFSDLGSAQPYSCDGELYRWVDVVSKNQFPDDGDVHALLKHDDGFLIYEHAPVFTFTTAAQSQHVGQDAFGILTTGAEYKNWRLRPYLFDIVSADQREDGKYTSITLLQKVELNQDPIDTQWTDEPVAKPVRLIQKTAEKTSTELTSKQIEHQAREQALRANIATLREKAKTARLKAAEEKARAEQEAAVQAQASRPAAVMVLEQGIVAQQEKQAKLEQEVKPLLEAITKAKSSFLDTTEKEARQNLPLLNRIIENQELKNRLMKIMGVNETDFSVWMMRVRNPEPEPSSGSDEGWDDDEAEWS